MSNASQVGRRAGLTTLAVIACAAAVVPSSASAASNGVAQGKAPVTEDAMKAGRAAFGANASESQAVSAYWTPERMASARPVEEAAFYQAAMADADRQARLDRESKSQRPDEQGAPFSMAGTEGAVALEAAYNPNLVYNSPTARTMGKVFFTKSGGNYVCSGTVINSEGADSVWTAGHCVHGGSGGTWHSNWSFAPAYDDDLVNKRPYGTWTANNLNAMTSWTNSTSYSSDMGVAVMNTLNTRHISTYLGGQGIRWNWGKNLFENAFGYPAETPFDGGNLWRCWGNSTTEYFGAETIKIPCNLTRGSSGGAWLHAYDGNWGYLNGVNSRIDRILNPTIMLSPYFDNTARDLYNFTRYK